MKKLITLLFATVTLTFSAHAETVNQNFDQQFDLEAQEIEMMFVAGATPMDIVRAVKRAFGWGASTVRNVAACASYGSAWLGCRAINDAEGDKECNAKYYGKLAKYCN